jgi:pyruvate dehydrogenase E2 component (dihydrolipoamide acetyltransferase)
MAKSIRMPELGESITEGTITRWLKQEGDRVEVDEPLFEVSTDKVDTEVPSPVAGVLTSIKVREDETVAVGTELAEIEPAQAGDGQAPEAEAGGGEAEEAEAGQAASEEAAAEATQATGGAGGGEQTASKEDRAAVASETAAEEAPAKEEAEAPGGGATALEVEPAGDGGQTVVVRLPELGESITEGTITRWLKQEGDRVEVDEPLFEISTDKVDTEVPSPVAGVIQSIKVRDDETVPVGTELVEIATGDAAPKGGPSQAEPSAPAKGEAPKRPAGQAQTPPAAEAAEAAPPGDRGREEAPAASAAGGDGGRAGAVPEGMVVSPLVRRLAREHRIDLSQVRGSGAGGRVRREDVEAYLARRGPEPAAEPAAAEAPAKPAAAEAPAAPPAAPAREPAGLAGAPGLQVAVPLPSGVREEVVKATRTRRLIAERMVTSLKVSAQLTAAVEVDMTGVMRLRERAREAFKQREGVSLSPLPFCVQAMIAAVKQYPNVNSALDSDGNLHIYKDVNLGVAVDTPKGLYVPVVKNADSLNLSGLAKAIADVATRTRDGKITPDELSGSTITVTNTGSRGAVWDTPIINQPNAAIFATPAIVKRPAVVDDPRLGEVVAVRHIMYAVLTYDHRIIDGADAARFLVKIKEVLEEADFAAELGLP